MVDTVGADRHDQVAPRVDGQRGPGEAGVAVGLIAEGRQVVGRLHLPAEATRGTRLGRLVGDRSAHEALEAQPGVPAQPGHAEAGHVMDGREEAGVPRDTAKAGGVLVVHLAPTASCPPARVDLGGREPLQRPPGVERPIGQRVQPQSISDERLHGLIERASETAGYGRTEQDEAEIAVVELFARPGHEAVATDGLEGGGHALVGRQRVRLVGRGWRGAGRSEERAPRSQAARVREQLAIGHPRRIDRPLGALGRHRQHLPRQRILASVHAARAGAELGDDLDHGVVKVELEVVGQAQQRGGGEELAHRGQVPGGREAGPGRARLWVQPAAVGLIPGRAGLPHADGQRRRDRGQRIDDDPAQSCTAGGPELVDLRAEGLLGHRARTSVPGTLTGDPRPAPASTKSTCAAASAEHQRGPKAHR